MIFDQNKVTQLVLGWQRENDPAALEQIAEETRSLIEAIVSGYPSDFREDLIQESSLKIQYSLKYYKADFSIHNYFTTVIHNACRTFIRKQYRDLELYDSEFEYVEHEDDDSERECQDNVYHYLRDDDSLSELIVRNRIRFPSLPVSIIDDASEIIIVSLRDGLYGRSRGIIAEIARQCGIQRQVAAIVYYSSLIFLREKFIGYACKECEDDELSLMRDLKEIVGNVMFRRVTVLLSGIPFRLP